MEVAGLLEHVLGDAQAVRRGHGGEVGEAGEVRDNLRRGGDQGDAELQL